MSDPNICFNCEYCQYSESDKELVFRCVKKLREDWNVGFYRNVFTCDGFELSDDLTE